MKLTTAARVCLSGIVAVSMVVLALWMMSRAHELSQGIATALLGGATADRWAFAIFALAIAVAAGAQRILIFQVVPAFYRLRRGDHWLVTLLDSVVAAGLIGGLVRIALNY